MGIVLGPDTFTSEFVTDCLELIVGGKKPTTLIHDVMSGCNVEEELAKVENDDYKRYLQKVRVFHSATKGPAIPHRYQAISKFFFCSITSSDLHGSTRRVGFACISVFLTEKKTH